MHFILKMGARHSFIIREKKKFNLTPRMREVWCMLAYGLSHKEIASAWKRSLKTVEYHRAQLFKFFGFPDFSFMVRLAIGFGLIDYENIR